MRRGQGIYSYSNSDSANPGGANPRLRYHDNHNMPDPIEELLIPQLPEAHMSGDVVLLDIDGVVPGWGTYVFSLDVVQPGQKVSHSHSFFFKLTLSSKLSFASSTVLLRPILCNVPIVPTIYITDKTPERFRQISSLLLTTTRQQLN